MNIYHATFKTEGWNDKDDIGYYLTKQKAWEACFIHHPIFKILRTGIDRYEFHYKYYTIKKIKVQI